MATFQQIIVNLIVGIIIFLGSIGLFGGAVRFEYNRHLAPRTWSRPIKVLKNVLQGCYCCKWYSWGLNLSYTQLLDGIPGTGTREDGWAGPKLKTNLGGIIMLKFHKMLMKICAVTMIPCMLILFPVFFTAECDEKILGKGTCDPINTNLTTFEESTIAHMPPFDFDPFVNGTNSTDSNDDEDISEGIPRKFFIQNTELLWRYFMVVLVAFIIYIYTCILLRREWIENVALRRVYYLEYDHYEERLEELEALVNLQDIPETEFQKTRPPWLPHPELRETPPDVALFSALYKLPSRLQISKKNLPEDATHLEKQMAATVGFFDECVPNQPGYSSSVAAVTILPEATDVKEAWIKWYAAARKLRKLRHIRAVIQAKIKKQQEKDEQLVIFEDEKAGDDDVEKKEYAEGNRPEESMSSTRVVGEVDADDEVEAVGGSTEFFSSRNGDDEEEALSERGLSSTEVLPSSRQIEEGLPSSSSVDSSPPKSLMSGIVSDKSQKLLAQTTPGEDKNADNDEMKGLLSELSFEVTNPDSEADSKNYRGLSPTVTFSGSVKSYTSDDGDSNRLSEMEISRSQLPQIVPEAIQEGGDHADTNNVMEEKNKESEDQFLYSDFRSKSFALEAGILQENENGDHFDGLGVEQLSVYAREYAQNSSNACPFGFAQNLIKFSNLERLKEMELKAEEKLHIAVQELEETRAEVLNKISNGRGPNEEDHSLDEIEEDEGNSVVADIEEGGSHGLRKRTRNSERWHEAERMAQQIQIKSWTGQNPNKVDKIRTGWQPLRQLTSQKEVVRTKKGASLLSHPTYAVVTFTSRQAAIAARQCMTDGGGLDRWSKIDELPVPPLADAPPRDIFFCRGFCRPVSLTISDDEKRFRTCSMNVFFVLFSLLYTVPLAITSQLLNPTQLAEWFPDVEAFQDPDSFFFQFLAGISSGLVYTVFFSICPQLFKAMAFYKGDASSIAVAEDNALFYYWIFMLLTAFTGSSLANMLFSLFSGVSAGDAIKDVLVDVASTIPTQQAPVWLNWIVVRFTYTLPFMYLFQFNTFGFAIIRWPWCNRVMRGGGPGGPPPYRIYIDGATVFLCAVALGPACPFITPFAFIYFCVMNPMLRWMLVFVYRPKYDGGGNKWPMLHEVVISSLILSQVLLSAILFLKYAYWAALAVFIAIWPTYYWGGRLKHDFERQYLDAGLLQTSKLDGWDTESSTSRTQREEYRRWLVDCHKASYVPVCLATSDCIITSEPCAVIPNSRDVEEFDRNGILTKQSTQRGALFRREKSNHSF